VNNPPDCSEEAQYLDWAAGVIATAVRTKDYIVAEGSEVESMAGSHLPVLAGPLLRTDQLRRWNWVEVMMPVRQGAGKMKVILLGRRQGGQRYLSEDMEALARTSGVIADHIETMQRQEMKRLVSQAELRALQSQINPHFLFNALNTLYGTIPREASGARRMVLNLAEVFRYFLQSDRTFVPLEKEMEIVKAYLEVEQLRLGDRLKVEVELDDAYRQIPIPVLSVQPLVENAVKHGVARSSESGYVRIRSERSPEQLCISVENSGSGHPSETSGTGTGLENVRRRLEICYGPAAVLKLTITPERARAELQIPCPGLKAAEAPRLESQQVDRSAGEPSIY
jgi:sensor histidine kinase YesM